MAAAGIERAHGAGVSLGAAVGMHRAARHPERVLTLGLHGGWHRTDNCLRVTAPTQTTFGAHDICTSTRFADAPRSGIGGSEVVVFDHLSHAGLHDDAEEFNGATLEFLMRAYRRGRYWTSTGSVQA